MITTTTTTAGTSLNIDIIEADDYVDYERVESTSSAPASINPLLSLLLFLLLLVSAPPPPEVLLSLRESGAM